MVMMISANFVPRRRVAVSQFRSRPAIDKGFEIFVDRSKTDLRQLLFDGDENFIRSGMMIDLSQVIEDGRALSSETRPTRDEHLPQLEPLALGLFSPRALPARPDFRRFRL